MRQLAVGHPDLAGDRVANADADAGARPVFGERAPFWIVSTISARGRGFSRKFKAQLPMSGFSQA
ncbi:MAG: hypothetical protein J0G94_07895 [Sphingomonadales bacterium]|nr:hypothetical protein [Sphingomonadales bacterium]